MTDKTMLQFVSQKPIEVLKFWEFHDIFGFNSIVMSVNFIAMLFISQEEEELRTKNRH